MPGSAPRHLGGCLQLYFMFDVERMNRWVFRASTTLTVRMYIYDDLLGATTCVTRNENMINHVMARRSTKAGLQVAGGAVTAPQREVPRS